MALIAAYAGDSLFDHSTYANDLIYVGTDGLYKKETALGAVYTRDSVNSTLDYLVSKNSVTLTDDFTMSCWAFVSGAGGSANGLVSNHNHDRNVGAGINVKLINADDYRISCNTGNGTTRTYMSYHGTTNIKNKWCLLSLRFVKATNELSLWVNGVCELAIEYPMVCVTLPIYIHSWSSSFNNNIAYRPAASVADVRIYDHALTDDEILSLYRVGAKITSTGNLYAPQILETKHHKLMLDYTVWRHGNQGSSGDWAALGPLATNRQITGLDPFGKNIVLWDGKENIIASADSGFTSKGCVADPNQLYRYSVWIRRPVIGNGRSYLGLYTHSSEGVHTTRSLLSNTVEQNPYFWHDILNINDWILVVGHLHPHTYTDGITHKDSGVYRNFKKSAGAIDYRSSATTVSLTMRSYLYYSTMSPDTQQWCYPRIDKCDGTEPTIAELLAGHDSLNLDYIKPDAPNTLSVRRHLTVVGEINEIDIDESLVAWYLLKDNLLDFVTNEPGVNKGVSFTAEGCKFPGDGSYIGLPDTLDYSPTVTTCGWFRSIGAPVNNYHTVCGNSILELSVHSTGYLRAGVVLSGVRHVYNAGEGLADGEWHFLALTYDGTTLKTFADGIVLSSNVATGVLENTVIHRGIGMHRSGETNGYGVNGYIADYRVYKRPLSDTEIVELYTAGIYVPNDEHTVSTITRATISEFLE